MRNAIISKITECAGADKNIFMVTGDAGFGILDKYKELFPDRYLNLGVAEQNMIGFSAGLSLSGYKVIVYNIVPFVLYRCYEQVRNDICYQRLPIILVGIGSGVTYAPGGVTHYSVEDISVARTLPNLIILSPSDPVESEMCIEYALKSNSPVYIRIAKTGEPKLHEIKPESIQKPLMIKKGEGVAVLFHGSISGDVVKAAGGIKESPIIISVPMLVPLDFKSLLPMLGGVHTIITVEEHFVEGGLGSIVAEWIVNNNSKFKLMRLGIRNEFIHSVRSNAGLREEYGFSPDSIRKAIREAFNRV